MCLFLCLKLPQVALYYVWEQRALARLCKCAGSPEPSLFACVMSSLSWWSGSNEPLHDKTNKMTVRPAKTQISLGIPPVWSESSLCTKWVAMDTIFLPADSEDSDQIGQMPRLIWVFCGCTCYFLGFVMRWLKCRKQDKMAKKWQLDTPDYYQEHKGQPKWLRLISSHFPQNTFFSMTLLHAHAQ